MLENERVGQRSGVSPVRASVRSQKKSKVRREMVSSSASMRGVEGAGAGAVTAPPHPSRAATARAATPARKRGRGSMAAPDMRKGGERPVGSRPLPSLKSEPDFQAELDPARIGDGAACLAEIGVVHVPDVVAPQVLGVEDVEAVDRQPEVGAPQREILAEPRSEERRVGKECRSGGST